MTQIQLLADNRCCDGDTGRFCNTLCSYIYFRGKLNEMRDFVEIALSLVDCKSYMKFESQLLLARVRNAVDADKALERVAITGGNDDGNLEHVTAG